MKPSGPASLFLGRFFFFFDHSFNFSACNRVVISISSWFSLGRLNFSRNLSISSRLSILLPYQFSSVAQSCPTLCDSMNRSTPGLPLQHQLPEFTQTHVHWVGVVIQPSHALSSPSSAFNLSQHQSLFKWVSSSHQVAKVLEFQLQHQSFQWIFRTDFL